MSNLYPFEETVASGAAGGGVRRADRHRRPGHGARRGQEPRQRRRRHRSGDVPGGGRGRRRRRVHAGSSAAASRPRPTRTRPRYDAAVASWFASVYAPDDTAARDRLAGRRRRALAPPGGAALRREPAPARRPVRRAAGARRASPAPSSCTARRCPTTTTWTPTRRWRAAFDFAEPCVAIIKHANPCGIAIGADLAEAHRKAHACDPVSAYGGVIAANGEVTRRSGRARSPTSSPRSSSRPASSPPRWTADGEEEPAAAGLPAARAARPRGRVAPGGRRPAAAVRRPARRARRRSGQLGAGGRAGRPPTRCADLAFAWRACRSVKSNAILLATDGATVGVGMGQVNRVDAARLAVTRARERAIGAVAASDAYFPFADGLQVLAGRGRARRRRARRVGPRRRGDRGRAERRGSPCTSPAPGTSSTDDERWSSTHDRHWRSERGFMSIPAGAAARAGGDR